MSGPLADRAAVADRALVRSVVDAIEPVDDTERQHRHQALAWIDSGAPIHRVAKPATPPQHLVSYALLIEPDPGAALLIDHRLSGLWLPTGGHVEVDEDPAVTAQRELTEELGVEGVFPAATGPAPFFITVTPTTGPDSHVDVSLWFALVATGDDPPALEVDEREAVGAEWLAFDQIRHGPGTRFDPHLPRAVAKLGALLGSAW